MIMKYMADKPETQMLFPSVVEVMATLSRLAEEQQKIILLSTHDVELALRTVAGAGKPSIEL